MPGTERQHSAVSTDVLAGEYLDAGWNLADREAVTRLAHPDLRMCYPLMPEAVQGREAVIEVLTQIRAGLPDLRMRFRPVLSRGETAVLGWTARAGGLFGLAPTGRAVRWTGLTLVEMAEGRVTGE